MTILQTIFASMSDRERRAIIEAATPLAVRVLVARVLEPTDLPPRASNTRTLH